MTYGWDNQKKGGQTLGEELSLERDARQSALDGFNAPLEPLKLRPELQSIQYMNDCQLTAP